MKLMINCRQSSELISRQLDEELALKAKIQLGAHLFICKACPIVLKNFKNVKQQMKNWRHYSDSE